MRVDVLLGEAPVAPADVAGRVVVVVVDVLRAVTTVATALSSGARAVIPFETIEATIMRGKAYARGEVLLPGERRMVRPEGFDLGNSPLDYTPDAVAGRTVLYSTTNGTAALTATHGARSGFSAALTAACFADDVRACLTLDRFDVAVRYADRQRQLAGVAPAR